MRRTRHAAPLALLAALLLTLALAGCSDDEANPTTPTAEAPALPDAEQLMFDFSFFDAADGIDLAKADGEYDHFINAYLRVALLDLVAHLTLAPPVAAFSAALHTPPSPQDDGSWIWVYTHVDGPDELQIRLRGLPVTDGVEWELRVTAGAIDNEVWFAGSTHDDGDVGQWTFYDLEGDPDLAVAAITWGGSPAGRFLSFEVLAGEDAGDQLSFFDNDPEFSITHVDASEDHQSNIVWWADGHGSLQVTGYNGGLRACWDTDFINAECE